MPEPPPDLAHHQPALLQFAARRVPAWLQGVLCPDDLVQETFEEAYRAPARFVGMTAAAVFAYLREALQNNLYDAIRKHAMKRADVSAAVLAESSVRLAEYFAADHTSPSERAERSEWFARLADAINNLPDAQRVAVEMRYLRGLRVGEIARKLDRSVGAVSLLLHRALAALRGVLDDPNA
jgi:RNA polymerase sigma-70 factor, ECF subfamily